MNIDSIMNPSPAPTVQHMQAAVGIAKAVGDAIRDLGQVPAGALYTQLLDRMELATFEALIGLLVRSKLVERRENHLLVWIGQDRSRS